jgi:hypothetical protein
MLGFPFSRPNRLLVPDPGLLLEKLFAEEMNLPILARHCIAIEAVWKVLRSN